MGMIEIRTFGSAEINAGADRDSGPLLAQPKRFAVLCYLALPRKCRVKKYEYENKLYRDSDSFDICRFLFTGK